MHLKALSVSNFRSIDKLALEECGPFNVLIGKNNSGKSTILTSLYAFLLTIRDDTLVYIDPPIGKALDFHKKRGHAPIDITATFHLSASERDALVADIAAEASQMKNAAASLPPTLILSVTLRVVSPKSRAEYAYVKDMYIEDFSLVKPEIQNTYSYQLVMMLP